MKKKMLIAGFLTIIILLVPFTAIANVQNSTNNIELKKESITNLQPTAEKQSTPSTGKINFISNTTVDKFLLQYKKYFNFHQIQKSTEQKLKTLEGEENLFCLLLLFVTVCIAAVALGLTIRAIINFIDDEGWLALIDLLKSSFLGGIACSLAVLFVETCLPQSAESSSLIEKSDGCGCMQVIGRNSIS
jgi:hypothetical protein